MYFISIAPPFQDSSKISPSCQWRPRKIMFRAQGQMICCGILVAVSHTGISLVHIITCEHYYLCFSMIIFLFITVLMTQTRSEFLAKCKIIASIQNIYIRFIKTNSIIFKVLTITKFGGGGGVRRP